MSQLPLPIVGKTPKVMTRNCSNKKKVLSAKSFSQDVLQQVGWEDDSGRHLVFGPPFVHIDIAIVGFVSALPSFEE
uniref:Uncharacterized protein n=1 Tax=Loa loa TaxID=7209 RepID=A0A1I7VSX0_LOALO